MVATFRPRLVNGRFGDPALFVELAYERQAILFDMGDLGSLSARDLLRIDTVGVSHMHIDHLIGFDLLLRINVGRTARIRLVGPEGLAEKLGHKLRGYSWDLVDRYDTDLTFEIAELVAPDRLVHQGFRLSRRFEPEPIEETAAEDGVVMETPHWTMKATILEHHGPCLGFALSEPRRINVWRNRVDEAGLAVGPWLKRLKDAVRAGCPDSMPIHLPDGSAVPFAELRHLVESARGQKLGYVTDVRDTLANRAAIRDLCKAADTLFIEGSFAAADAAIAQDRAHLTTRAAGEIARSCRAARVEPFHFSPRYENEEERLLREVEEAFVGESVA